MRKMQKKPTTRKRVLAQVVSIHGKQTLQLPPGFRLKSKEVYLEKFQNGFVVLAKDEWDDMEDAMKQLPDSWMKNVKELDSQERHWWFEE